MPIDNYKIENWFSVPILSHYTPEWSSKLLKPSLKYLDDEKINRVRFYKGRTTYDTKYNLAKQPEYKSFLTYLKKVAKTYLTDLGFDYNEISKKFDPYFFTTELNKGSYQERHIHKYQLSGILYLKVPEGSAQINFCDPIHIREYLSWPILNPNNPNTFGTITYKPIVGSLLLWPSWLYHEVPTHTIDDNRIGLVLNL
jgi:uncharacterized protein (TIGR02466 family)|tara:strand:+ start:135 stop:728 length:594 start_codon:yes stop_codon:yes gene_type:complete